MDSPALEKILSTVKRGCGIRSDLCYVALGNSEVVFPLEDDEAALVRNKPNLVRDRLFALLREERHDPGESGAWNVYLASNYAALYFASKLGRVGEWLPIGAIE